MCGQDWAQMDICIVIIAWGFVQMRKTRRIQPLERAGKIQDKQSD